MEARRHLEQACALQRNVGDRLAEARTLGALADVLMRLGETEQAVECCESSVRLRSECGDRVGQGWMLHRLALAHGSDGSGDRARECAAQATRIAAETGDPELVAACRELPRALGH